MPDTGFKFPTVSVNTYWGLPDNVFASNDVDASTVGTGDRQRYSTFAFGVPGSSTINGIEVAVEGQKTTLNATLTASLSWDAGSTWTSTKSVVFTAAADETLTFGGAADLWGRTWADTEFSDTNFRARFIQGDGGRLIDVDAIQIKVYYDSGAAPAHKVYVIA